MQQQPPQARPTTSSTRTVWEALIDLFEKDAGVITVRGELMSSDEKIDVSKFYTLARAITSAATTLHLKGKLVEAVYQYWINKRKQWGKALIRIFQEPPPKGNTDPHVAFRPRTEGRRISKRNPRKDDFSAYNKMRVLSRDFSRVMDILDVLIVKEDRQARASSAEQSDMGRANGEQLSGTEDRRLTDLRRCPVGRYRAQPSHAADGTERRRVGTVVAAYNTAAIDVGEAGEEEAQEEQQQAVTTHARHTTHLVRLRLIHIQQELTPLVQAQRRVTKQERQSTATIISCTVTVIVCAVIVDRVNSRFVVASTRRIR